MEIAHTQPEEMLQREQQLFEENTSCPTCFWYMREVDYNFYTGEVLVQCTNPNCRELGTYEDPNI
jgi:hypothetical protein